MLSINSFSVLPYIASSILRSRKRRGVIGGTIEEGLLDLGNKVILIVGGIRYSNFFMKLV